MDEHRRLALVHHLDVVLSEYARCAGAAEDDGVLSALAYFEEEAGHEHEYRAVLVGCAGGASQEARQNAITRASTVVRGGLRVVRAASREKEPEDR